MQQVLINKNISCNIFNYLILWLLIKYSENLAISFCSYVLTTIWQTACMIDLYAYTGVTYETFL